MAALIRNYADLHSLLFHLIDEFLGLFCSQPLSWSLVCPKPARFVQRIQVETTRPSVVISMPAITGMFTPALSKLLSFAIVPIVGLLSLRGWG